MLLVIYSSAEAEIVLFVGYSLTGVWRMYFLWDTDLLKWIYCIVSDVNECVFSCLIVYFSSYLQHTNLRRCVTFSKKEC